MSLASTDGLSITKTVPMVLLQYWHWLVIANTVSISGIIVPTLLHQTYLAFWWECGVASILVMLNHEGKSLSSLLFFQFAHSIHHQAKDGGVTRSFFHALASMRILRLKSICNFF